MVPPRTLCPSIYGCFPPSRAPIVALGKRKRGNGMATKRVWKSKEMILATLIAVGVLGTTVGVVLGSESQAREKLQDRFADRTEAGATFVGVYMREMLAREARLAALYLSGDVSPQRIELLTRSLDSSASVLLDTDGNLIGGYPHNEEMVGAQVAEKYGHLSAAVDGDPTISPVVLSAVEGVPVVGAATPFETPAGRRVFSAALSISGTPLAQYLETMLPIKGASAHLFDDAGTEVINDDGIQDRTTLVAAATQPGRGIEEIENETYFYVASTIEGAPWKIVAAVPTASLYAPFQASRWGAWMAVGVLALFAVALLYLFGRFTAGRHDFRHRALHCPLTGLANRHLLQEHASRELGKLVRMPGSVALMYIDLDDFKSVNDNFGHDGGDQLLVEVAARLRSSLRPYDVPARLGGDEFAVLLPDVSPADAEELAARILFALEQPFELGGRPAKIGSSVGIALTSSPLSLDDFLDRADGVMYEAKRAGKGRYLVAGDAAQETLSIAL